METPSAARQNPATWGPVARTNPFGPGKRAWDDFGDLLFLSMGFGSYLLQTMHPAIGSALYEYSDFRTSPYGRAVRSFDSVMLWVYGGENGVDEGDRIQEIHRNMRGVDTRGNRYHALTPEIFAWPHATVFATSVVTAPYVRGAAMTPYEEAAFYNEMLQLGDLLHISPRAFPQNHADFWDYYHATVSDTLELTPMARETMRQAAAPPIPGVSGAMSTAAWPLRRLAGHPMQLLAGAGLTPDAREILGINWTRADELQTRSIMAAGRALHARLPERMRYVPLAAASRRRMQLIENMQGRATHPDDIRGAGH